MQPISERLLSRRAFVIGGTASLALAGYGLRGVDKDVKRDEQKVASLPPLPFTPEQAEQARDLVKRGSDYLNTLTNQAPNPELESTVVDFQSSEFATAVAIVPQANAREQEVLDIQDDLPLSFVPFASGLIGAGASAVVLLFRGEPKMDNGNASSLTSAPSTG